MALLERVATLLRANLNDLIDRAEDPEKMIKQVILDMQNQLIQVKTQVAIAIADQHLLRKQLANQPNGRSGLPRKGRKPRLRRAGKIWRARRWNARSLTTDDRQLRRTTGGSKRAGREPEGCSRKA